MSYDNWHWCPECGEPREVCLAHGQCPLGQETKKYQQYVNDLLDELEGKETTK